jgi:hypothetical protein
MAFASFTEERYSMAPGAQVSMQSPQPIHLFSSIRGACVSETARMAFTGHILTQLKHRVHLPDFICTNGSNDQYYYER